MPLSTRRIALVCMTPAPDANELSHMELPSYGIRRILAATVADRELEGAKVSLIDMPKPDVDACVNAIESLDADLVGMSIYSSASGSIPSTTRSWPMWSAHTRNHGSTRRSAG